MKWEREGWGRWDYTEQGWSEIDGEWKLLFTTNAGRREWLELDRRRRVLVEERAIVITPKRKRDGGGEGGTGEVGTPEKRRCLGRKRGGGGSPDLRRMLVEEKVLQLQRGQGAVGGQESPEERRPVMREKYEDAFCG